jgi:hypothetical protein
VDESGRGYIVTSGPVTGDGVVALSRDNPRMGGRRFLKQAALWECYVHSRAALKTAVEERAGWVPGATAVFRARHNVDPDYAEPEGEAIPFEEFKEGLLAG